MISLNTLKDHITNFIDSNNSSVIYFGVGSYYKTNGDPESNDTIDWRFNENQQFPLFLHDFKFKNPHIPILIILIDPEFDNNKPYIVSSSDNFLENSWTVSDEFSNLYFSSLGINVIKISDYVYWNKNYTSNQKYFNFENFMIELCDKVSNNNIDTLLFYHEFTGINVILFENLMKKKCVFFDCNKICIDITRGSDMSCYFNLSNPEFYPVIINNQSNKLKYVDTNLLTNDEKTKIIGQYKKFTIGFEENSMDCIFSKNSSNYLFDKPDEMILCFQIIKIDKIILNHLKNGIIPLLRYLYVGTDNKRINLKMSEINYLLSIKYNFQYAKNQQDNNYEIYILNKIDVIIENIMLISDINNDKFIDIKNDDIILIEENIILIEENIILIKENIITNLFDIIEGILLNIFIKYNINPFEINKFIENIKKINNKYNMLNEYNKFISILNI